MVSNIHEYTVSEISQVLKRTVEDAFSHVRVRGEISGLKRAASGHVYCSLKDQNSVLSAVCWRGVMATLPFHPEDGLEVVVTGRISTYPGRSSYQIIVEFMEPAGVGALMALLEKRKQQLMKEGLFEQARKKPLPYLPQVIGVVTSPTGAVIRDILHRIADRFPCHVLVWPVLVQGEGSAGQIAAAIHGFNALPITDCQFPKPDLLIVARGGGSLEDLWAFNEEIVVRAAAASRIPLISAVGHETDTTLIDFAADRRAPTPTAAAEMAVPVKADLIYTLKQYEQHMFQRLLRILEERSTALAGLARGLLSPKRLLETMIQRLDDWSDRLHNAWLKTLEKKERALLLAVARLRPETFLREIAQHERGLAVFSAQLQQVAQRLLESWRKELSAHVALLESFHYKKVLERGYVLVRDISGAVLSSAAQVTAGKRMTLEFRDGLKNVVAEGQKTVKPHLRNEPGGQESLF